MKILHAVAVAASIVIGFQASGKAYPGLEVGFTFREVRVVVSDLTDEMKKLGITEEAIKHTINQKLLSRGLKPVNASPTGSYIYIPLTLGIAPRGNYASCFIHCSLAKNPSYYGLPIDRGLDSTVYTGTYGNLVGSHPSLMKETILEGLKEILGRFILDYRESNRKYEATFTDKRLRGVDRAIKGNSFRLRQFSKTLDGIDQWRKRYEAMMKKR